MSKYLECGQVGVYFLLEDKEIVYIGATTDWPRRMLAHIDKRFNRIRFIPCDKSRRYQYERRLLSIFNPKYNIRGIGDKQKKELLVAQGVRCRTTGKFLKEY